MTTRRRGAFTLVELLVAVAITSGLVVLLMSVVSGTLNIWQRGLNQVDTFSNARQALTRMADEIQGAMASTGQIEFSENVAGLRGSTAPAPGSSENVFFVAPYPNSAAGDLCAIAYRHNSDTHELQRAFVKSDDAWNAASNRYRSSGYSSLTSTSSAPQSAWRTVAQGVLEFEVISFSQSDLDNNATPNPTWNSESGSTYMLGNVPHRVILRMKVIDDKSLARLNALPASGAAHDLVLAQSARQFSTEVTLLAPK